MAAGSLIVEEAGGKVSNYRGEIFDPLRDNHIIATTPGLFEGVLGVVKKTFPKI